MSSSLAALSSASVYSMLSDMMRIHFQSLLCRMAVLQNKVEGLFADVFAKLDSLDHRVQRLEKDRRS